MSDHEQSATPGEDAASRHVAPGGWRRAVIGLLLGVLAGAAIAFILPRDDLPRRRELEVDPPRRAG